METCAHCEKAVYRVYAFTPAGPNGANGIKGAREVRIPLCERHYKQAAGGVRNKKGSGD